jgi:RNA polymerase sigma-70 factor (ECF subfamily)
MLAEEKALLALDLDGEFERFDAVAAEEVPHSAMVWAYEASLIARLRAGEQSAFEELVTEYQPLVYALILHSLGNAEDARDATQETFLKIYRHFERFRGEASLKTWICRIAINQARSTERWWRRRRRNETSSLDEPADELGGISTRLTSRTATPESQAIARERRRQLQQALGGLKKDFRVAVVLRDIQGLSYEEIASILEISVGTVKSRIARGREMLRVSLKEQCGINILAECRED